MLNTTRFRPTKLAEAYLALMSCGVIQTAFTASSCHASSDCRAIGCLSQNARRTLFAITFMGDMIVPYWDYCKPIVSLPVAKPRSKESWHSGHAGTPSGEPSYPVYRHPTPKLNAHKRQIALITLRKTSAATSYRRRPDRAEHATVDGDNELVRCSGDHPGR